MPQPKTRRPDRAKNYGIKRQISRRSWSIFIVLVLSTGTVSIWSVLVLISYCTEYFFGTSTGTGTDWQILVLTHLYELYCI